LLQQFESEVLMKIASFIAAFIAALGGSPLFSQAQDDLSAKAQSERELVIYGTALAGHFENSWSRSVNVFPSSKRNTPALQGKP
jgi:hypothetical protein